MTRKSKIFVNSVGFTMFIVSVCSILACVVLLVVISVPEVYGLKFANTINPNSEKVLLTTGAVGIIAALLGAIIIPESKKSEAD